MVRFIKKAEEKTLVPIIYFNSDNGFSLVVADQTGREWNILGFRKDGTVYRNINVSSEIGLQVDELGRIKIEE